MADNYYKSASNARSSHGLAQAEYSGTSLRVIKTDVAPTGESVHLVRPMASDEKKSTADIVGHLVGQYDYKSNDLVKASK